METAKPGEYFAGRALLKNTIALKNFLTKNPNSKQYEDTINSQMTIVTIRK